MHIRQARRALDVELEPGAQANQLQQVSSDAAKIAFGIEKRQGGVGFVDHHTYGWMLSDPAFLALCELQLLVGQQQIAACVPASGYVDALLDRNRLQCLVDDAQQLGVFLAYGEAEAIGLVLAEVRHLDVVQVALVDDVLGRNGVAQKYIDLVEGHGIDGVLKRRVMLENRAWISRFDLRCRQVVIDHAQAHAFQAVVQGARFSDACDQHGLVHRVGLGQPDVALDGFEAVGGAQQIDLACDKRPDRCVTARETLDPDREVQRARDDASVISRYAFVIVA